MREKKIFSSVNLEEANVLTSVCESKHCFAHIKEKIDAHGNNGCK